MLRHRTLTRLVVAVAAVALGLVPTAVARAASTPRPDAPNGRTVTLTNPSTTPGGVISFTGTGYINDSGLGQTVTVKLNDVDILGDAEARADGTVSGSVTIPASLAPGEYWLRFLSGTGKDNDMPPSSVHATFVVVAVDTSSTTTTTTTTSTTAPAGSSTTVAAGGATTVATTAPGTTVVGVVPGNGQLVENGFDSATLGALGGGLVVLGCGGLVAERIVRRRRHAG